VRLLFITTMPVPYLILNESTLFYLNLSATKTSKTGKVENWTVEVAKATKDDKPKVSRPSAVTGTSTTVVSAIRRTTTSSSAVVTVPTVPTTTKPLKKKAKLEPKAVTVTNSAVATFLDEDESVERDAALSSPIKGNQRLTSKVRCNPA
jgi:hypothetical protein